VFVEYSTKVFVNGGTKVFVDKYDYSQQPVDKSFENEKRPFSPLFHSNAQQSVR